MKPTREEQERLMRSALEMLERAKPGGKWRDIGDTGPVDPSFAAGWAKSSLRRALGLSDQPTGDI